MKLEDMLNDTLTNPQSYPPDSLDTLSREDQDAIRNFSLQVADVWLKSGHAGRATMAGVWLSGFMTGHNVVKNNRSLW